MGTETYAVRIYGENDLRLEKFELPDLKPYEILIDIITNSASHVIFQYVSKESSDRGYKMGSNFWHRFHTCSVAKQRWQLDSSRNSKRDRLSDTLSCKHV